MQAKPGADGAGTSIDAEAAAREEADARSIYIGQVDYGTTPEELQMHFQVRVALKVPSTLPLPPRLPFMRRPGCPTPQDCGTVNRVTILSDKMGNPKVRRDASACSPPVGYTCALLLLALPSTWRRR